MRIPAFAERPSECSDRQMPERPSAQPPQPQPAGALRSWSRLARFAQHSSSAISRNRRDDLDDRLACVWQYDERRRYDDDWISIGHWRTVPSHLFNSTAIADGRASGPASQVWSGSRQVKGGAAGSPTGSSQPPFRFGGARAGGGRNRDRVSERSWVAFQPKLKTDRSFRFQDCHWGHRASLPTRQSLARCTIYGQCAVDRAIDSVRNHRHCTLPKYRICGIK